MLSAPREIWKINQLLFFFMSFGVIMVIAKWSSDIIIPLLISTTIALLLQPLMLRLERWGLARILSLILVIMILIAVLALFGIFVVNEINQFASHAGELRTQLHHLVQQAFDLLHSIGLPQKEGEVEAVLRADGLVLFFKQTLLQLGNQFSNTLLILFTASFLILDNVGLRSKMHRILQENPKRKKAIEEVFTKIYTYFNIMAKVSLVTAISAFAILWYFKIEYALLWASLTFFLNFIPVIGSIIAAVPPVILALLGYGWSVALWVALGYLLINNIVGNILQPTLMGRGLGLSSFAVFWSMVFWGWFFGPTGMILSVPLTMGVQFMLMQYDETRWMGFLLSDYEEKELGKSKEKLS